MNGKPNIVVIIADDLGEWALGCSGNKEIYTPNIDKIASRGVRLTNFFCTSPVCSPARASIYTGKIPSQHGIMDWLRVGNVGSDAIRYLEGHTLYTDILKSNGYICGLSGKWHMGDSANKHESFEHWFAHQKGGSPYHNAPMVRDGKCVNAEGYLTDVITDDAIQFMKNNIGRNSPFCININYTAPHAPWIDQHPQKWLDFYKGCEFNSCPQEPTHEWRLDSTEPTITPENVRDQLIGYFSAVSAMDESIGRVVDFLEKNSLMDNTIIVFMGDNGMNCGHHGIWGKGNGTFPANMYDTSLRVPAIFYYKGVFLENVVKDDLLSQYDFIHTLFDCLGIDYRDDELPGRSFLKTLVSNEGMDEKPIFISGEYGPTRVVRTHRWKYVHRYVFGPHEFYDLENDPDERNNLADNPDYEDQKAELALMLHEWFTKYSNPDYDGAKQPVKGKGQLCIPGRKSKGKIAFYQDLERGTYYLG
jgi:choline-sulfatase